MKIAICKAESSFTQRWIDYCEKNGIVYTIVNPYDSDIVDKVSDCDAFMWHHHHGDYRDCLFARQLLMALETKGIKVFPDNNTNWHFDDKVGQKYLFEAIGAPMVPSYVFYSKEDALNWVNKTTYPKVFKLRGGAGSSNVKLVRSKTEAARLIRRAFGKGFSQFDKWNYLKERYNKWRNGQDTLSGVVKSLGRLFVPVEYAKMRPREKGYVYFQDFIPDNEYDIRVCIVGDKAFAIRRDCRKGDFRASGSGMIGHKKDLIDERCVKIAFDTNKVLKCQSVGFDFVFDQNTPLIVECSFGYVASGYDLCQGYWTEDLNWHEGDHFDFCGWMIENLISK